MEGWSHSPTSKADPDWLEAELSTVKSVPQSHQPCKADPDRLGPDLAVQSKCQLYLEEGLVLYEFRGGRDRLW